MKRKLKNIHWLKREGSIHPNKNKKYEDIYGKEKASELKKNLSNIAKNNIGSKNGFFNKSHSEKTKNYFKSLRLGKTYEEIYGIEKATEIRKKKIKENKKPESFWYLEYEKEFFNKKFRFQILEEQNYKCLLCNCDLNKNKKNLHHINYIKSDCNRKNLIYLCISCHSSTNKVLMRNYYSSYLSNLNMKILDEREFINNRDSVKLDNKTINGE